MAKTKKTNIKKLVSLDWEKLIRSKTFWLAVLTIAYGIYSGQSELVLGGAGAITLRDAITN